MVDLVQVTSANAPMLFTFGDMRVSAVHARGGSINRSTSIADLSNSSYLSGLNSADQFEIVRNYTAHIFQYGMYSAKLGGDLYTPNYIS